MAYEDFIKQYRSGRNPITGEPNLYRELTDQTIWDAAQAEIRQLLDIEHRRRVAAENRKCNTCEHYIRESNKTIKGCGYLPNGKSPKKWFCADYKSIIKEAGE